MEMGQLRVRLEMWLSEAELMEAAALADDTKMILRGEMRAYRRIAELLDTPADTQLDQSSRG